MLYTLRAITSCNHIHHAKNAQLRLAEHASRIHMQQKSKTRKPKASMMLLQNLMISSHCKLSDKDARQYRHVVPDIQRHDCQHEQVSNACDDHGQGGSRHVHGESPRLSAMSGFSDDGNVFVDSVGCEHAVSHCRVGLERFRKRRLFSDGDVATVPGLVGPAGFEDTSANQQTPEEG